VTQISPTNGSARRNGTGWRMDMSAHCLDGARCEGPGSSRGIRAEQADVIGVLRIANNSSTGARSTISPELHTATSSQTVGDTREM